MGDSPTGKALISASTAVYDSSHPVCLHFGHGRRRHRGLRPDPGLASSSSWRPRWRDSSVMLCSLSSTSAPRRSPAWPPRTSSTSRSPWGAWPMPIGWLPRLSVPATAGWRCRQACRTGQWRLRRCRPPSAGRVRRDHGPVWRAHTVSASSACERDRRPEVMTWLAYGRRTPSSGK
jgi:hypothetical protein